MHIERTTTIAGRAAAYAGAVALVVFGAACGSALDVPNPQAFGDEALNNPIILKNVANGAEGSFHQAFDDYIVYTELLSDEIESTSTWIDWEDVSEGRIRHDWPNQFSFSYTQDQILQARFAAQSATERIDKVLGADAQTSPLRAQTMLVDAMADLLLGTGYCESPLVADGPRSPDTEVFAQAITKFTAGLEAAEAITGDADAQRKWTNVAHAGRARANLMAGNYDAAKADAQAVDPGFEYQALYSEAGGYNTTSNPGEQFNQNRNRSGGLRRLYHSRVHVIDSVTTGEAYLRDWSSGQDDHRMAVTRFEGQLGVNNRFAYYGITKYADRTSPIRMLSKIESNLIEAEVAMRAGDYATEAQILNVMRARPGVALPPIPVPGDAGAAQNALVNERMAELWVEGSRMQDLYRFNLVTQILGPSRATKLPLSTTEILNNSAMKLGEGACPTIS
jgi:SusD/RagB-like outer membrane lipoprotein